MNTKSGESAWGVIPNSDWLFHPSDPSADAALIKTPIPAIADHLAIPPRFVATQKIIEENEIGLGDEVFITGLFRHHHGLRRNIPIVRTGNLAAMNEEKIQTKGFGETDAHLIEARSIGGLSGSPAFVNLGIVRGVGKEIKYSYNGPIFI